MLALKKNKVGPYNEIPPVVYGGVATWIVNFIKMFEGDEDLYYGYNI